MGNFSKLPEGCVSLILSMTSPRDACRLSAISSLFNAAADSDSLWESFLPSDYRQIVSRSVSPVVFSTKKQLYFSLCESPPLLDGGKLSFALDRETGKKCYTLPAREVAIAWKEDLQYWEWISLPESRFLLPKSRFQEQGTTFHLKSSKLRYAREHDTGSFFPAHLPDYHCPTELCQFGCGWTTL